MDITKILNMIDSQTKATAGEVLILTHGEYDSHRVLAVVRVRRDINLRLLADDFLSQAGGRMTSPAYPFDADGFVTFLESDGAVEVIKTRSVDVADDHECVISTPVMDRKPENDPSALPYEWAEAAFDPQVNAQQ